MVHNLDLVAGVTAKRWVQDAYANAAEIARSIARCESCTHEDCVVARNIARDIEAKALAVKAQQEAC